MYKVDITTKIWYNQIDKLNGLLIKKGSEIMAIKREYVERRRYDVADRLAIVIEFTIIWLIIALIALGKLGIFDALIGLIIFSLCTNIFAKFFENKQPWLVFAILFCIASWNGGPIHTIMWSTLLKFLDNLVVLAITEFSFEFVDSKLKIRSNGKYGDPPAWLKVIAYPFALVLAMFGIKNQPVLAYAVLIGLVGIPAILLDYRELFSFAYYVTLAVCLYRNRKANK